MVIIRTAQPADALPLAQLAEQTFRDTFGTQNLDEDLDLYCRQSYSEAIQADEISALNRVTLLAQTGGQFVGFVQLRWGRTPPCVDAERPGEIQRIYVRKEWHGRGLAGELMNACLEEIRRRNTDVVWLGVWERNHRAIAFYKKFGFVEVGEHVFPLGRDPQRDVVMARSLAAVG